MNCALQVLALILREHRMTIRQAKAEGFIFALEPRRLPLDLDDRRLGRPRP